MSKADIEEVKKFWETHPLFLGESSFPPGSEEFFTEHTSLVVEDCFAGKVDQRIFSSLLGKTQSPILDAGCGIGFWLEQFKLRGFSNVVGVDLSASALKLAKSRLALCGADYKTVEGNLEELPFAGDTFVHVNCQGVIHHTPNPQVAVAEIARVLQPGGTASVSVYYDNILLRNFDLLKPLFQLFGRAGSGLKGRGRESILFSESREELVRKYDGDENPLGVSYSRKAFEALVGEHFEISETFLHFFPRRGFKWIPKILHRFLDKHVGFMVYASLVKKDNPQGMKP